MTSASQPLWLFRVAGRADNGGGHVSRSLVLAEAMRDEANIMFSVAIGSPFAGLIRDKGFQVIDESHEAHRYDGVWLDTYTDDFERYRKKTDLLAIIEDHKDLYDKADVYIRPYPGSFSSHQGPEVLSGLEYAFIDPVYFKKRNEKIAAAVKTVSVFMGRYDSVNATRRVLEVLSKRAERFHVQVVMGGSAAHLADVKSYLDDGFGKDYTLIIDSPDLSTIYAASDFIILSGGVAVLEACAMSRPAIVLNIADNQVPLSQILDQHRAIIYAGTYASFDANAFSACIDRAFGHDARQSIAEKSSSLLTEAGADKVAKILLGSIGRMQCAV